MTAPFEQLREWFERALELPEEARADLIEELTAENAELGERLATLLDAERASAEGFVPPTPHQATIVEQPSAGTQIGRYRLGEVIATGGMGIVFEAEQDDPRRTVALKMMRVGFDSPAAGKRFRDEAQLLARLQHPGIAQVYETGVYADSTSFERPWFAMELIENAVDIARHCDDSNLDVPERLRLFIDVCDAVHHGHQRGIIHRDLKPDNILVDRHGRTKVIDFGVARTTDADVQQATIARTTGEIVGTLLYMSPEQLEGNSEAIDTRTDVHALGLILYEMLTGTLPYDLAGKTLFEIARIVRDVPPRRPNETRRQIKGDLELILLKAIAKEQGERYDSAAALAEDLRRCLNNDPIAARPPSLRYQLRMLGRRHRGFVAALAGGFVIAIAAAITSTLFWLDSISAQKREHERAEEADAVTKFVVQLLQNGNPIFHRGEPMTVEDLLELAARDLEVPDKSAPAVRARLLATVGLALTKLDVVDRGAQMIDEAIALRSHAIGDDDDYVLKWQIYQARATWERGDPASAEELLRDVLGKLTPQHSPSLLPHATFSLGGALQELGRLREAEQLLAASIELAKAPGVSADWLSNAHRELGAFLYETGRSELAQTSLEAALVYWTERYPKGHVRTIGIRRMIALCLRERGELTAAEMVLNLAIEESRRITGENNLSAANLLVDRAALAHRRGRFADGKTDLERAIAIQVRSLPADHPRIAWTRNDLAVAEMALGNLEAAADLIAQALATYRDLYPDGHLDLAKALGNAAHIAWHQRDLESASEHAEAALAMLVRFSTSDSISLAFAKLVLVDVAFDQGDRARAEELAREVSTALTGQRGYPEALGTAHIQIARAANMAGRHKEALAAAIRGRDILLEGCGPYGNMLGWAHFHRGWALSANGEVSASCVAFRESVTHFRRVLPPSRRWMLTEPIEHLAKSLIDSDPREAALLFAESLVIRKTSQPATHPGVLGAQLGLGRAHQACGDIEAAEPVLLAVHAAIVKRYGKGHRFAKVSAAQLVSLYEAAQQPQKAKQYRH